MGKAYNHIRIEPTQDGHLVHVGHDGPMDHAAPPPRHFTSAEEAGQHAKSIMAEHDKAVQHAKDHTGPSMTTVPAGHPLEQMHRRNVPPPQAPGGF